ncbi:hypothetical protein [Kiloniella sp. EL199]|uniref:hypothetical protein n=1 Tax=Kiloniella sp. EL199 TaxID=2107581 RepID=UPI000EA01973|nr:hypothetical protein [Kiloniella sp. EL199]
MKNSKTILIALVCILTIMIGAGLYLQEKDQVTVDEAQPGTAPAARTVEVSPAEKIALQATAFSFAETAEIYVQDGHNLRLKEPQPTGCAKCFTFVFDHYGDPGVIYELNVRINDEGQAEWIKE